MLSFNMFDLKLGLKSEKVNGTLPSAAQAALVQPGVSFSIKYIQLKVYTFIFLLVLVIKYPCSFLVHTVSIWSIDRTELFISFSMTQQFYIWLLFKETRSDRKKHCIPACIRMSNSCLQLCLQGQGCVMWIFQEGIQKYFTITQGRQR